MKESDAGEAFDHFRKIFDEVQKPPILPREKPIPSDTAPQFRQIPSYDPDKTEIIATHTRQAKKPGEEMPDYPTQTPSSKPPPPPLGIPPKKPPPSLGTQALPLPPRIGAADPHVRRITPDTPTSIYPASVHGEYAPEQIPETSAYSATQAYPDSGDRWPVENERLAGRDRASGEGARRRPAARRAPAESQSAAGCLMRSAVIGVFLAVIVLLIGASVLLFQYYSIARTLPDIEELRQRASQFETTRIYDRQGGLLYEILDPNAGRRTYVPLDKISPFLIAATLATEDKEFYSHPGYDAMAIVRAFWQNYTSGEVVSGASTITQQLARTLLFSPEERSQKSYQRKLREAILAAEITRRYSKDEILELYLNEIYYGNLAYGAEAAAQTYYRVSAENLSLSQAAFLAGLPQAPSVYDVFSNRDAAFKRTEEVLFLMFQASKEQGCIFVSNNQQPVCVDAVQAAAAATEVKNYPFQKSDIKIEHPHWVNYVRSLLELQYDAQTIYRSGFSVYTTLDPELQKEAERIVNEQISALQGMNARSGALVAIQPANGEILAMVGSADYFGDKETGQVNMAVSPRQPGSAIKPLTYAAAFEKGWTPATLIWDVPTEFPPYGKPDDQNPPYRPVNYDGLYHGPVTVRYALANSYNIPAVKTLQFAGIYGDPNKPGESGLVGMAERLGITTFTRQDYGLSLTLGGGEVKLLDLSAAYAVFAAGGRRIPPVAITRIVDYSGNEIFQHEPPAENQVLSAAHAFLITSILSDNDARSAAFGYDSVLNLPFQAAAKTGTTNDFRDNWTIGYTPDLVVGVWIGNPDYTPMINTTGLTGAAPIWSAFMQYAVPKITNGMITSFARPADVNEEVVCSISGTQPSQWCPSQYTEFFAPNQPPLPKEQDLWRESLVDTWTNYLASRDCADFAEKIFTINVSDPWAVRWLSEDAAGRAWAKENGFSESTPFTPERECASSDPRPTLSFAFPHDGETIQTSPLAVYAIIGATADFSQYGLFYGAGRDPQDWQLLAQGTNQYMNPEKIAEWDISQIPAGDVTLRLYMTSTRKTFAERRLHLHLQVPTPTQTTTPTITATPTETVTPMATVTLSPLPVTPSDTPAPASETPSQTPEATMSATP